MVKTNINDPTAESKNRFSDLIFFVSSIIFNLAISGLYLAVKLDKQLLLKICGLVVVLLIIPFTITLIYYYNSNSQKRKIVMNLVVLFYLLVELLLDYILKIPFRDILSIHIPYIIIFYAASYSMIIVVWRANWKKGLVVLSTFLILIFCLIYMFSGNERP